MTIRHPLWYENPPPTEDEMAAAFVGERPTVPGGRIVVAEPDPAWPDLFETERQRIQQALGTAAQQINHVGSTSVPGLPAKPIIDIDLIVADSAEESAYLPALEAAGYRLLIREPDWEQHRLFKGPATDINVHVFSPEGREWRRHLLMRDWLRTHPADRDAYGAHKRSLGERRFTYTQDYNEAKHAFIAELLDRIYAADLAAHPEIGVDI